MTKLTNHFIYCAGGNYRFAEIAVRYGVKYGSRLPNTYSFPLFFTDQDWENPQREDYMEAVKQAKPNRATVIDLEQEEQLEEVLSWAEEISDYVEEAIIIIPKVFSIIPKIPETINGKKVILGYSVPTSFDGTEVPTWEFKRRPVHLLGGSPQNQYYLAHYLNVDSVDNNYIQKMAIRFNAFYSNGVYKAKNKRFPKLNESVYGHIKKDACYTAFELSIMNYKALWTGAEVGIRWAVEEDLKAIKKITGKFSQELGYVMYPSLRRAIENKELYVAYHGLKIVGFCNWHMRKDGTITIYEIATDKGYQGEKVATALIEALPHANIQLKCTVDNEANFFYEKVGFQYIGTEDGKKRPLNVWKKIKRN